VIILILEHACHLYVLQPKPTRDQALDQAYSQYCVSNIYDKVIKQFSAPPVKDYVLQFIEFILKNRL
jgi:hypothetical protein